MSKIVVINDDIKKITYNQGKRSSVVIGKICRHCDIAIMFEDESDAVVALEHITYCNPAHKRAEYGEKL